MADRRLQVFHAVGKYGSFTRAATHLFMTQPAVTFQIKQLEEHFDTRLLDRGHGKITLTPAGQIVYDYAEKILGLSEELESRVAELTDELSGMLSLGASTTIAMYWLPELLTTLKRHHPRVMPRVMVGNSQRIVEKVAARELDIGLIEIITDHPALEQHSVGHDELFVICAPDYPLAQAKKLKAADLVHYPFITRDPGNAIRDLAEQFFNAANIDTGALNICAELGTFSSVRHLAMEGFGFALASGAAIRQDGFASRLTAIPLNPPLYTPFEIIIPRDKFRSRLVTTFSEYAQRELTRNSLEYQQVLTP